MKMLYLLLYKCISGWILRIFGGKGEICKEEKGKVFLWLVEFGVGEKIYDWFVILKIM